MFFQNKHGRKTSLAEADTQKQIRSLDDFGSRCRSLESIVFRLLLVFLPAAAPRPRTLSLLFFFVLLRLFSALANSLVAKGDQIAGILFDSCANPSRKLLEDLWVVSVFGAKVLDADGRVLG